MRTALGKCARSGWLRSIGTLGVAIGLLGVAACPKPVVLDVDTRFSVNLVRPSEKWPSLDHMTPAELDAHEQFGKPDFFRIWYNRRGTLASKTDAGPDIRNKRLGKLPRSWVYEAQGFEICFLSPTKFEKVPLSDRIKVTCRRGDPQEVDRQRTKRGDVKEYWTYWDVGEKYTFLNGKQVGEPQIFKGMDARMHRL